MVGVRRQQTYFDSRAAEAYGAPRVVGGTITVN